MINFVSYKKKMNLSNIVSFREHESILLIKLDSIINELDMSKAILGSA